MTEEKIQVEERCLRNTTILKNGVQPEAQRCNVLTNTAIKRPKRESI